jgi:starch-binding outer membrane protein, SusD/RagB family
MRAMRNHRNGSTDREGRMNRASALFAVLLLGLTLASCDRALDVVAPGVVDADDLGTPDTAPLLVSGALSDLECALGAYIVNQGLLGNELRDASVTAARFTLDRRDLSPTQPYGVNSCAGNPPGIYRPLSTARWSADNALERLDGFSDAEVPGRTRLIGQAATYAG